jgi:3-oxoacyl-[acyl-carrier protein] reductase
MDLGIAGRKAIICASSRGLGRGCALALAEAGCDLAINGRDAALLEREAKEIANRFGVTVTPVAGDVGQPETQRALLAAMGEPDILVNNNSGPPLRPFRELDREKILAGVTQNMVTPLELIQAALPGMTARRFGRIVNITSYSVKMPIAGLDLSSGARAGLTAFLAGVCRTVASDNVTINNLLPGRMDTDRLRANQRHAASASGEQAEAIAARQAREVPAGRFGTPEEFGEVCAFLCPVHAGYITGQNILIDGGLFPGAF